METKSIFENSKFGDKFRTSDGKKVIFSTDDITGVYVFYQGMKSAVPYHYDGTPKKTNTSRMLSDIVSRWQEPLNEEKLEEIANGYNVRIKGMYSCGYRDMTSIEKEMFKAGYREAKQE